MEDIPLQPSWYNDPSRVERVESYSILAYRYLKGTMILPVLSGLKALMGMGVRSPITMTLSVSSGLKENFLYRPQGRW
ncbi:hypothetical protein [Nostoc sp. NZL]|uniref:hypothetical protein n=1 Tax=Nostoc sp. NZL TaxID=2650612 RepID=UPI003FA53985